VEADKFPGTTQCHKTAAKKTKHCHKTCVTNFYFVFTIKKQETKPKKKKKNNLQTSSLCIETGVGQMIKHLL
jgi:hypothetical protein